MTSVSLPHLTRSNTDANLFSDVVDNDNAIASVLNGGIDNTNIAAGAAIAVTKLDMSGFDHLSAERATNLTITGVSPSSTDSGFSLTTTSAGVYEISASLDVKHAAIATTGTAFGCGWQTQENGTGVKIFERYTTFASTADIDITTLGYSYFRTLASGVTITLVGLKSAAGFTCELRTGSQLTLKRIA